MPSSTTGRRALAVADANWFTTENLFRELDHDGTATLLLKCSDYYNAWQRGDRPFSWGRALTRRAPNLWQREMVLPSGWMKRFPSLGMRPIRRSIDRWRESCAPEGSLTLVMTYPYYLYLRDQVRPDRTVYFNIDDYSQYWPRCADRVNALELQAVRESELTVCVSRARADQLRAAVPEAAGRIRHLPHGAPSSSLGPGPHLVPAPPPDDLACLPGPRLGYVGSLEDRIDWDLLTTLADSLPNASIVLIGKLGTTPAGAWQTARARCLDRPNVYWLNWRPQDAIGRYNAAFDVCLIPYRVDHPFNQVSCPTKIMDYMASGRPIVSTAVPECQLYDALFDVAADTDTFVAMTRSLIAAGPDADAERSEKRFAWACDNSCRRVVERFVSWLPD
ncbi:MAG: hypothetical protein JWN86_3978 [Planctomycetota bacterium]|nr:hypothetical protein [Planctomycetota bacterium]